MKYACLVYLETAKLHAVPDRECQTCGDGLRGRGILVAAEALQPTETATSVRVRNGKVLITDGPFAETKEQLAGYYILDCADLDEAIDWARRIPTECGGATGCVEIRPFAPVDLLGGPIPPG